MTFIWKKLQYRKKRRVIYQPLINLSVQTETRSGNASTKSISLGIENEEGKIGPDSCRRICLSQAQPSINEKRCLLRGQSECQGRR